MMATLTNTMSKERIMYIAGLVHDYNKMYAPYSVAHFEIHSVWSTLVIYTEYGKRGYGHIETFKDGDLLSTESTYDKDLRLAEERLIKLMEGKYFAR